MRYRRGDGTHKPEYDEFLFARNYSNDFRCRIAFAPINFIFTSSPYTYYDEEIYRFIYHYFCLITSLGYKVEHKLIRKLM